ncbi:MAG TPA: hypothetical protein DEB47_05380 [Citreicella sp.]|jgi:hypothetical protein|nr:hypothetical protein [Idiomarinaceae bacterium]HBS99290.1 hypothetical protein [Citreicella sp.]|tara:strand:- start:58 stop:270 length:213 start_codon:yes stop_codon:yes gene_type:complete
MIRVHRIPLPAPFLSVELIEIDQRAETETGPVFVKCLYMADACAPQGLRFLKSQPGWTLAEDPEQIEVVE